MTIVGPLPWGSGGHHKSKNPVNNHKKGISVATHGIVVELLQSTPVKRNRYEDRNDDVPVV